MNFEEFKREVDILKSSTVKTVNWKAVSRSINGTTHNTVMKYVNSSERPPKPDLELCEKIIKSAKAQFMSDYTARTIVKQRLEQVA